MTDETKMLFIVSADDNDIGYLRLPGHPGDSVPNSVAKTISLSSLLDKDCGTELYFDFDKDERLIGVEILL